MGQKRGHVVRGHFGRRHRSVRPGTSTQWLSPEAYDALGREEKAELSRLRQGQRAQSGGVWPARPRQKRGSWRIPWWHQGLIALAVLGLVAAGSQGDFFPKRQATPLMLGDAGANFGYCHTGGGFNCVVDGDTIWFQGQKIRIADIDAPETHEPRCPSERALGDRATARLHELVNSGPIMLRSIDRDEDRYGRKLRIVEVDGESVGDTLVGEGLARWYEGGRRPWC